MDNTLFRERIAIILEERADRLDEYYNSLPEGISSEAHAEAEILRGDAKKLRTLVDITVEKLRELVYQAAGAATVPLLEDHPRYVFPSERVQEAVEHVLDTFDISKGMESLTKVETAAAVSAIRAVIDSGPGIYAEHPLKTVELKLAKYLKEFNNGST